MYWDSISYQLSSSNEPVSIDLPASKSISNRLLVMRFLSQRKVDIENLSTANDTEILKTLLSQDPLPQDIDCEDAGTVFRFMACLCATQVGQSFRLYGTKRLLNRPMNQLIECLNELGAALEFVSENNEIQYLAVRGGNLQSKALTVRGDLSSQFITGLCLIAPMINGGLHLQIAEPVLSKPYISLTLNLLDKYGVKSSYTNNTIIIPQQPYIANAITVESDWSSAVFFYAIKLLSPQLPDCLLNGLGKNDAQGDKFIVDIGEQLGIQSSFVENGCMIRRTNQMNPTEIVLHLADYPDLAVPLLVAAAFVNPTIRFSGLSHLRFKESNRIEAIRINLEKFGILLKEADGVIFFEKSQSPAIKSVVKINTYNDHRIAMSFSMLAVLGYEILLDDTHCVRKSFPGFFEQIAKLGFCYKKSII